MPLSRWEVAETLRVASLPGWHYWVRNVVPPAYLQRSGVCSDFVRKKVCCLSAGPYSAGSFFLYEPIGPAA